VRAAVLVLALLLALPAAALEQSPLAIEAATGRHAFTVELAATPQEKARGLMYRRELAADAGMLFVYPDDGPVSMWMKNTFLPLDMLFLAADGRIVFIAVDTVPGSLEPISAGQNVRAVLELNAGTALRLGIAVGDRVRHPALNE